VGSLFEKEIQDHEFARFFAQEKLIVEATEFVCRAMKQLNVSRSELASLVGTTKSNVTQLLGGSRNMTLRTFADLMFLLGERVELDSLPFQKQSCTSIRFEAPFQAKCPPRRNWNLGDGAEAMEDTVAAA